MSIEKMKETIEADLAQIRKVLSESRGVAKEAAVRVTNLERQESAWQAALSVLSGQESYPEIGAGHFGKSLAPTIWAKSEQPAPPAERKTMLNGEEIVLEPGFKIGKNSLGEDCIVPEGFEPLPMAEPTKPLMVGMLPISAGEGFEAPEDQL